MVICSLSGSLRNGSSNSKILQTLKALTPAGHEFIIHPGIDLLPHYNPDLDKDEVPDAVREFRGILNRSHAMVISTPEYAHGIPGSLKNALDWIVSTTLLEKKPVAVIISSASEGTYAKDALVEVLNTINAKTVPELIKQKKYSDSPEDWQELKLLLENLVLHSQLKS